MFSFPQVSFLYTAAAYLGTSGLITQVFGIGHIATHCGSSKNPMHSVHLAGSMTKEELLSEMALFGHSPKHAEQPVQEDSLIMYAMVGSLLGSVLYPSGNRRLCPSCRADGCILERVSWRSTWRLPLRARCRFVLFQMQVIPEI